MLMIIYYGVCICVHVEANVAIEPLLPSTLRCVFYSSIYLANHMPYATKSRKSWM